jgi:hypothetical protein
MTKIEGIDEREIKCCDPSPTTNEAGISFDNNNGQNILRFHFLDLLKYDENGKAILHQRTKSMWLNNENTKQLIDALSLLLEDN